MDNVRCDLVLLGIDARRPRLRGGYLTFALAGSLLIELTLKEQVALGEKNRVEIADSTKPTEALAAEAFALISSSKKTKDTTYWISVLASRIPHLVERSAEPLVSAGVLRIEKRRWLGLIPYRVFELIDRNHRERLIANLLDVLRGHRKPDTDMIHLVQLAHAACLLVSWFPKEEKKVLLDRLVEIGRNEMVGKAVDAATAAIVSSVATTAAITAAASSTS
jgi:hypothetical protein